MLYGIDYAFEKRAQQRWERYSYQAMNKLLAEGQEVDDKVAALKQLESKVVNCTAVPPSAAGDRIQHVSLELNSTKCQGFEDYEQVLILTPARQMGSVVKRYFRNLLSFKYPLCRIRVAIGVNQDDDATFNLIQSYAASLSSNFSRIDIYRLSLKNDDFDIGDIDRHLEHVQLQRRSHIAQVRNALLFAALQAERWILWIDSDVREIPPDVLDKLLASGKDIIVPSCMYRKFPKQLDVYDKNTWRETNSSRQFQKNLHDIDVVVEGYSQSKRIYLNDIQSEGPVVELDGVGGCCLLVKADVHRKGVIFPPYVFRNHIDTEGFAQAAKAMGYKLYGMPFVQVIHWEYASMVYIKRL